MNAFVTIRTDSLIICEARPVEGRTTMEALLMEPRTLNQEAGNA